MSDNVFEGMVIKKLSQIDEDGVRRFYYFIFRGGKKLEGKYVSQRKAENAWLISKGLDPMKWRG